MGTTVYMCVYSFSTKHTTIGEKKTRPQKRKKEKKTEGILAP